MILRPFFSLMFIGLVAFISCDNQEDFHYGNSQLDFVEMITDNNGVAQLMGRDRNDTFNISNPISGFKKDTVYRCVAVYSTAGNDVTISSYAKTISSVPSAYAGIEIRTDPLNVQSIWRGGKYVNITARLRSQGYGHSFAFVDKGTDTQVDGSQILKLQLYHNQGSDPLTYNREVFLSCPLYKYDSRFRPGIDSISFTIREFQGEKTWRLPF